MARRRNIWEQIWESTEGPTVTVTIPRDHAESLLHILAASLEEEGPGEEDDMGDLDFGGDDEIGLDDGGGDDMGMDLDLDVPAGDDDDEMVDEPSPPKKGPGRPPGAKNKKKPEPETDDDSDDDKDDDDKKEEGAGEYRPQTALGESSFSRLNRVLAKPRKKS
jgi:TATA-binding protein-associated factor Taf7